MNIGSGDESQLNGGRNTEYGRHEQSGLARRKRRAINPPSAAHHIDRRPTRSRAIHLEVALNAELPWSEYCTSSCFCRQVYLCHSEFSAKKTGRQTCVLFETFLACTWKELLTY